MADRAALLIAVETFFEAGAVVPYAAGDCAELLRALPAVGYAPERCTLLAAHRTTKAVIEATPQAGCRSSRVTRKSLLVLGRLAAAFSAKGRGYIACADTIAPDPIETALPVADLLTPVNKVKAKEITVLFDIDPLALAENKSVQPGL